MCCSSAFAEEEQLPHLPCLFSYFAFTCLISERLLDIAETSLLDSVADLKMRANLIRKDRAVGIISGGEESKSRPGHYYYCTATTPLLLLHYYYYYYYYYYPTTTTPLLLLLLLLLLHYYYNYYYYGQVTEAHCFEGSPSMKPAFVSWMRSAVHS